MMTTAAVDAQIIITTADLPAIGTQVIRAIDDVTQISPGNPGLNQVWDFTNLNPDKFDTTLYLPMQGLPNYQNYPDANMGIKHLNGGLPGDYDYDYARSTSQGLRYAGDEDFVTIFPGYTFALHITCDPEPLGLQLPFHYGDNLVQETTYTWLLATHYAGALADSSKQISHMHVTVTGDASGIMQTPYGSFPVLRVKEDIISNDTMFSWNGGGWVYNHDTVSVYSSYRWYANDYYEVGVYLINDAKGDGFTFFKSETIVGLDDRLPSSDFTLFPVPAQNQLVISSKVPITGAEVVNLAGQSENVGIQENKLDVSGLAPGSYILRIFTGNGSSSRCFVKQ